MDRLNSIFDESWQRRSFEHIIVSTWWAVSSRWSRLQTSGTATQLCIRKLSLPAYSGSVNEREKRKLNVCKGLHHSLFCPHWERQIFSDICKLDGMKLPPLSTFIAHGCMEHAVSEYMGHTCPRYHFELFSDDIMLHDSNIFAYNCGISIASPGEKNCAGEGPEDGRHEEPTINVHIQRYYSPTKILNLSTWRKPALLLILISVVSGVGKDASMYPVLILSAVDPDDMLSQDPMIYVDKQAMIERTFPKSSENSGSTTFSLNWWCTVQIRNNMIKCYKWAVFENPDGSHVCGLDPALIKEMVSRIPTKYIFQTLSWIFKECCAQIPARTVQYS